MTEETNIIKLTWQKLFTDIRGNTVNQNVGGGMVGGLLYSTTYFLVSQLGTYLISGLLILSGSLLLINMNILEMTDRISSYSKNISSKLAENKVKRIAKQELKAEKEAEKAAKAAEKAALKAEQEELQAAEAAKNQVRNLSPGEELARESVEDLAQVSLKKAETEQLSLEIDSYQNQYKFESEEPIKRQSPAPTDLAEDQAEGEELEFEIPEETENRDYHLPESDLLNEIPLTDQSDEYKSIEKNVGVLETTFKSFGVDAKVVRASLGPSVTKYEIQPAVGVKVSKIVGLTDDLALALAAKDIRMEAPIPGKSLIGIEVPNNAVSMVSFRDIIRSTAKKRI